MTAHVHKISLESYNRQGFQCHIVSDVREANPMLGRQMAVSIY